MRRQRRTKVAATLGPASSDRVTISRLFAAGADLFRINMRFAAPGQRIIVVAGLPLGTPGATNFMRIAYVADDGGLKRG
jgi:pyruvate kinase